MIIPKASSSCSQLQLQNLLCLIHQPQHAWAHTHTLAHTCSYIHTHTRILAQTHKGAHSQTQTWKFQTYAYIQTQTHRHKHTQTHNKQTNNTHTCHMLNIIMCVQSAWSLIEQLNTPDGTLQRSHAQHSTGCFTTLWCHHMDSATSTTTEPP